MLFTHMHKRNITLHLINCEKFLNHNIFPKLKKNKPDITTDLYSGALS